MSKLRHSNPLQTNYMRLQGRTGTELARLTRWTALSSISPFLVCSVVKAEDRRYFRHRGLDWFVIADAVQQYLRGNAPAVMGVSTIPQQLARNLYLGPRRSMHRKLQEAFNARALDAKLGKTRVLEIYLNVVEWGDGIWGISAASGHYFAKTPGDLDVFESVFLASLLPAPRSLPSGSNLRRMQDVQQRVLTQFYLSGLLGKAEWSEGVARIEATARFLDAGTPLPRALRANSAPVGQSASVHPPPWPLATRIAPEHAISRACGGEIELARWPRLRNAPKSWDGESVVR